MAEVYALTVAGEVDEAPWLAVLDDQERQRAARFAHDRDRRRFVVAHGALRWVLGRRVGSRPAELRFRTGAYGRPRLEPDTLGFSLAHSGDDVLIAVREGGDLGVDVEVHRPLPEFDGLLAAVATVEERAALKALPAGRRLATFFDLWTRKEALAKALGLGLSLPLTATAAPEGPVSVHGRRFLIEQLRFKPGQSAALARSPADDRKVAVRRLAFAELQAALRAGLDD